LRAWAPPDAEGRPALDLVLLGMGEDGHVASLFPDAAPEVVRSQAFYLPVVGPKPPPRRLSLSYRAIAAARQVWVLASGPGKEEALRESLSPQGRTPLGRVLQSRPRTLILTDIALGG
jgi:6-phosphogluconolactonase